VKGVIICALGVLLIILAFVVPLAPSSRRETTVYEYEPQQFTTATINPPPKEIKIHWRGNLTFDLAEFFKAFGFQNVSPTAMKLQTSDLDIELTFDNPLYHPTDNRKIFAVEATYVKEEVPWRAGAIVTGVVLAFSGIVIALVEALKPTLTGAKGET